MTDSTAFTYEAVRRDGTLERGLVEAPNREVAAALIGNRGAFVVTVSPATQALHARRRLSLDDLAAGLRALATLLGSGFPVGRALAILEDLVSPGWAAILPDLRHRVEQGEHLAAALEASRLPLPSHVLGVIQAGEAGSGLAAAVESAARLLENRAATRAAFRNAMAYPSILAVAGGAAVTLLVGVVLPRFANLLADTGQTLPTSTKVVLALGMVTHAALIPLVLGFAGALAVWRAWVARPEGQQRWHSLLLALPGVGPFRRSTAAAHACSSLAALLESGVALGAALPHAARATGDRALESRLLAARQRIATGERIASALHAENALTPTVVRLVRLGEETGRLAGMLAQAAAIESTQALQRLQRAIRVIEPAMILLFGGLVMAVAAALLQAMYGLRPGG